MCVKGGKVARSGRRGTLSAWFKFFLCPVSKTLVFVTHPPPPLFDRLYAYESVTKLIPESKYQYLTNLVSFATFVVYVTMTAEQKKQLLKAKVAVALQDELGRVPKQEEIDQITMLARVMYKAVLGLHYKRKEQKKNGQLAIF